VFNKHGRVSDTRLLLHLNFSFSCTMSVALDFVADWVDLLVLPLCAQVHKAEKSG
jgi:hypothetical protein